jgi:hypothetical protein
LRPARAPAFTVRDGRIGGTAPSQFASFIGGGPADPPPLGLLFGRLSNADLEVSDAISLLSVDALDALLSAGDVTFDSEEALLVGLLRLGPDFLPLLRHVRWEFVSPPALASALVEQEIGRAVWHEISGALRRFLFPTPDGFQSAIVADFPALFAEFGAKQFSLLWRGGRDGFDANAFHDRCDGHRNTLTLIEDSDGHIFGRFTPLDWHSLDGSSGDERTADHSGRSFLFTLKHPHNFPARRFSLKPTARNSAIYRNRLRLPNSGDIGVSSGRSGFHALLWSVLRERHGRGRGGIFPRSREIEVFELQD